MSNVKRIMTIAIVFAMVLGIMAPAFALSSDVVGTPYEEAAATLGALKIMVGDAESGNFRPNDTIIRSEFAKVAVTAMGLGDVAASSKGQSKFSDVSTDHWANGYINVASTQGLIIGDPDGKFRPDDKITYAEAATILVRAIGHEPEANSLGGYPTGYLVVAAQNQMTKNATGSANDPATRGTVAQMTFNSLTVKLMEQTGYGNDITYSVVDKTLLADKLDVTKDYGQIIANGNTNISGTSSLNDDEVMIQTKDGNKEIYEVGETNAKDLLGYNVIFYAKDEDNSNDQVLISAQIDKNKTDVLTVSADNIESISDDKTELEYWINKDTDNDPQEADIASDAKLIYNGKAMTTFTKDNMNITSGKLVLLDTNKDGKYDIINATQYVNVVVDDVILSSHKIVNKYGNPPSVPGSLTLDPDDKNVTFSLHDKDGQALKLEDLNEWDVVSVAMDKTENPDLIDATVVTDKVSGQVVETNTDEDGVKVTIGDKDYRIADNYTADINLEDEGTFYLDVEGKIAAVDTTSAAANNYAYLIEVGASGGIDGTQQFKLLNSQGDMVVYNSNDKITFNGTRENDETVAAALKDTNGATVRQLVTYELTSDGKLNKLETANNITDDEDYVGYDKYDFSLDKVYNNANPESRIEYKNSRFNSEYKVNSNTIVFFVPAGETDEDKYDVGNMSSLTDSKKYNAEIYDSDDLKNAKVVIITSDEGIVNANANIAVVDKVTDTKNNNGDSVKKLYAYQDGKAITITDEDGSQLVNLVRGDIIQFSTNAKGEIDDVDKLYDAKADRNVTASTDPDLATIYGTVYGKSSNEIVVGTTNAVTNNYDTNTAKVYKFDTVKNQVSVATAADIEKTGQVFIRSYKGEVKEIVIIKK